MKLRIEILALWIIYFILVTTATNLHTIVKLLMNTTVGFACGLFMFDTSSR